MSYDGFYGGLSTRGTVNDLLSQAKNIKASIEASAAEVASDASDVDLKHAEVTLKADQVQTYVNLVAIRADEVQANADYVATAIADFSTVVTDWVDLRPYLKPPYYWNTARGGKYSHPRIRKLPGGRVELDGVVSFNKTSGPKPISVVFNVPAPFRPPLTAAGLIFTEASKPLFFGMANWIVNGEVEYNPPRVRGDVMFIPSMMPETLQDGAMLLNGMFWYT